MFRSLQPSVWPSTAVDIFFPAYNVNMWKNLVARLHLVSAVRIDATPARNLATATAAPVNHRNVKRNKKTSWRKKGSNFAGANADEMDEELDIFQTHRLYDRHRSDSASRREMIQLKMVGQKYFRPDHSNEKKLTWAEREHIRYLHRTEPDHWTFQMIAEHFDIDFEVAKKISKSNWLPKSAGKKVMQVEGILPAQLDDIADPTLLDRLKEKTSPSTPINERDARKVMTWNKLREKSGSPESSTETIQTAPINVEETELQNPHMKESVLKWAENKDSSQLRVDEDKEINIFLYDKMRGYQVNYIV